MSQKVSIDAAINTEPTIKEIRRVISPYTSFTQSIRIGNLAIALMKMTQKSDRSAIDGIGS